MNNLINFIQNSSIDNLRCKKDCLDSFDKNNVYMINKEGHPITPFSICIIDKNNRHFHMHYEFLKEYFEIPKVILALTNTGDFYEIKS